MLVYGCLIVVRASRRSWFMRKARNIDLALSRNLVGTDLSRRIARGEYLALKVTFPTQVAAIEIELAPVRWVKPGSFGVEFIRIAPGSQQRFQDYLAALEGAASDTA
jgi:hypothetical protein